MNEKLKYAEMLEIPQSTCNITYKPVKHKRTKQIKTEKIKENLIEKVNNQTESMQEDLSQNEYDATDTQFESATTRLTKKTKQKSRFRITAVGVELCVIGALILTILISSAVMPNSGITSFFSNAFVQTQTEIVDNRLFSDFDPCFTNISQADVVNEAGVMTVKNQKSIYAPCDGKVLSVEKTEQGLYNITIAHSDNFRTVIKGAKYSYVENGSSVKKTIPIAHAGEQDISICFVDGANQVITDSVVETCSSLWA